MDLFEGEQSSNADKCPGLSLKGHALQEIWVSPDFSPGRWLLSETYLLSISYANILNIPPLQTALDAPSLVFLPPAGTCSLNRSYGYAFGHRHPLAAKILRDHRITW